MEDVKINGQKKKKRLFKAAAVLILTALHVAVVSGRDRVTFQWPKPLSVTAALSVILAVMLTAGFYTCIMRCITRLSQKEKVLKERFFFFAGYFAFMGIFWFLTWPGIFKGDEFYVLRAALTFRFSAMQSGLTSMFYILTLLFFPSLASIVFWQLLIICQIFAVIMQNLWNSCSDGKRGLLFIPFILLPVIDANLFTLRASLAGWLFLFVICLTCGIIKRPAKNRYTAILLCMVTGLVCAWRSEFIYLVICIPIVLIWLKKAAIKQAAFCFLGIVLFWQLFSIPNKIAADGQNKYPISLVLNPVANLLTEVEDLKGPDVYDDVMCINEVVDAAQLRKDASVRNISQYWNIPDVLPKDQLSSFMRSAIRLIIYYPGKFLKYRWQTFAFTNGIYQDGHTAYPGGEDPDALPYLTYYGMDYSRYFVLSSPPAGYDIRMKAIDTILCRRYDNDGSLKKTMLLTVFYNVLPVFVLVIISASIAAIYKKKENLAMLTVTFLQFPLVFLTAPAMFFMYYFCFYLSGSFSVILLLVSLIKDKSKNEKEV